MIDFIITFFTTIYNNVIEFFNDIIAWFNQGVYDFLVKVFAEFIKWGFLAIIKFKIWMVGFAWDIAKQILQDINISSMLNNAFASLDSRVMQFLTFFRIPEFLNILISAGATKIVLRFMGI